MITVWRGSFFWNKKTEASICSDLDDPANANQIRKPRIWSCPATHSNVSDAFRRHECVAMSFVPMKQPARVKRSDGDLLQPGGCPAPELKCEDGMAELVKLVERNDTRSPVYFQDFLEVFDTALDHLIRWIEDDESDQLKRDAGTALAERLRFLTSQEQTWIDANEAFRAKYGEFGDRRKARSPRSYLGWRTGDYVRAVEDERHIAALLLDSRFTANGVSIADLKQFSSKKKQWLEKLTQLQSLSPESADEWITVISQRMLEDEKEILDELETLGFRKQESKKYRENPMEPGRMRLSDYHPTISKAVHALASKPKGQVRGVTKP
jgi:hypothetical protein